MNLELIDSSQEPHPGYGAGPGYIIHMEYKCPWGKGTVTYDKDDIPGFRDKSTWVNCDECSKKYIINKGTATLK
ncbi:hypothetical protein [Enterococcus hirae]|uniref:hypothetical protein n=1 Tax=Enterococcus hirae TaxID=1354 RepID=UPI0037AEE1A6